MSGCVSSPPGGGGDSAFHHRPMPQRLFIRITKYSNDQRQDIFTGKGRFCVGKGEGEDTHFDVQTTLLGLYGQYRSIHMFHHSGASDSPTSPSVSTPPVAFLSCWVFFFSSFSSTRLCSFATGLLFSRVRAVRPNLPCLTICGRSPPPPSEVFGRNHLWVFGRRPVMGFGNF